jgi:hypothetical protein
MKFSIGLAVGCAVCEIGILSITIYGIFFGSWRFAAACCVLIMVSALPCLLMYRFVKDTWGRHQAASRAGHADASAR